MANDHIENYLKWYLSDTCKNPKFAILLKGEWGSGKTYFIESFMEKYNSIRQENNNSGKDQFLYISLYGLSSLADIDDQIFEQLHPMLASKGVAIAGKIAKGLLKLGLKINLDDKSGTEINTAPSLPEISLKSFLTDFKNRFLVFDDLERCNIQIEQVLGYINSFVEHQNTKVIIVANDDEIEFGLKLEEKTQNSKYHRIKEKVIGKTFVVEPDSEIVLESLINESTSKSRKFIKSRKDLCLSVFQAIEKGTGKRNYRAFGHVLRDIEYIWPKIERRYRNHQQLMHQFINIFMRLDYELQLSLIQGIDIASIESWAFSKAMEKSRGHTLEGKDDNNKSDRLGLFFSRHVTLDRYDIRILTYELWYKLICGVGDVTAELNEALGNTSYFISEKTPEWQKLWYHSECADEEIEDLINKVAEKIKNYEYTDPAVVLHVFGLFMSMCDQGYSIPDDIGHSCHEILLKAMNYIDELKKKGTLLINVKAFSWDNIGLGSAYGLGYSSIDKDEFKKLHHYYNIEFKKAQRDSLVAGASNILKIMLNDVEEFYKLIGNPNFGGSSLWNVAIFNEIDPSSFFDTFMKVPNSNKIYILDAIKERYKWLNNSDPILKEEMKDIVTEKIFWQKLDQIILDRTKGIEIKPSVVWAKKIRESIISKAIEPLEQFEKYIDSKAKKNTNNLNGTTLS